MKRFKRLFIKENRIKKWLFDFSKDNSGMTIVEVLMGFVILSILMGAVISLISFSSNMMYKSVDLKNAQEEMERNLCIKKGETTSADYASNPLNGVTLSLKIEEVSDPGMIPGTGDKIELNHGKVYKNTLSFGENMDQEMNVYSLRCE